MFNNIKQRIPSIMLSLSLNKTHLLMGVGSIVLTTAIVLSLWNRNQGYVALYGAQEQLPVAQVVEVLGRENIPYRVDPDNGQILVTEGKLPSARMVLAAKGISAVTPEGYELMDKEEMLGSSQFIQNVRYKRSLEGELAKSIMALEPVKNARVHLGLSESSSFVMTNKPNSSASVMVQLHYGGKLDEQQITSIIHLVAGSVPGMAANSVRVVDQDGNLLSDELQGADGSFAVKRTGSDVTQRIKEEVSKNIADLLTPLVGAGNFRVSVAPSVDLSRVEETQERLGKEPQVSDEQISQENVTNEIALGVPGSLSNRPANQVPPSTNTAQSTANSNQNATAETQDPRSFSNRNNAQRKYVFDRDIRHIRYPGYKLEKVSIAVALNQQAPMLEKITPEQLASITRLVEGAAGIEKSRGDTLTIDILAFTLPKVDVLPELKWWQDPSMQDWGKTGGIGLLALLTLLFGVRPLVQRFNRRDAMAIESRTENVELKELEHEVTTEDVLEVSPIKTTLINDDNLPPLASGLETKVEYLQVLARKETERVAEVLKQWINSNERSNSNPEQ